MHDSPSAAIKRLREQKGLSMEALSRKADVSTATVYRAEAGKNQPNLRTLAALAEALGVSVADLTHTPEAATTGEPCGEVREAVGS